MCPPAMSQHKEVIVDIFFPKGSSQWNSSFMGNGSRMAGFIEDVNGHMENSSYIVLGIEYFSEASPEGNMSLNEEISHRRGKSITEHIHKYLIFADHQIKVTNLNEDWNYLLQQIEASAMPGKKEILEIFSNTLPDDSREVALKKLDNGVPWNYMSTHFFPGMRKVRVVVKVGIPAPEVELSINSQEDEMKRLPEGIVQLHTGPLHAELLPLPSRRCWYLKTNLSGLGFLIANIHAEVDLGRGFSFALPVYYSAVDYFGETSKYRTFTLQPELRYWFNGKYTSFYAAAHAGLGWYNFTDGKWRIQDKDGRTPAIGGGISAGYRLPLQKNSPRWFVELGVGAGVYPLHYDRFHNEKDGALESTRKETCFGIDQLSVNLVYKFKK